MLWCWSDDEFGILFLDLCADWRATHFLQSDAENPGTLREHNSTQRVVYASPCRSLCIAGALIDTPHAVGTVRMIRPHPAAAHDCPLRRYFGDRLSWQLLWDMPSDLSEPVDGLPLQSSRRGYSSAPSTFYLLSCGNQVSEKDATLSLVHPLLHTKFGCH